MPEPPIGPGRPYPPPPPPEPALLPDVPHGAMVAYRRAAGIFPDPLGIAAVLKWASEQE